MITDNHDKQPVLGCWSTRFWQILHCLPSFSVTWKGIWNTKYLAFWSTAAWGTNLSECQQWLWKALLLSTLQPFTITCPLTSTLTPSLCVLIGLSGTSCPAGRGKKRHVNNNSTIISQKCVHGCPVLEYRWVYRKCSGDFFYVSFTGSFSSCTTHSEKFRESLWSWFCPKKVLISNLPHETHLKSLFMLQRTWKW